MSAASINTVITDAGVVLLRAAPGHKLVYTRAVCGSGHVEKENLAMLTKITNYVMDLSIVEFGPSENAATLRLQLDNRNAPKEFLLYQIGVYAKLLDGEEELIGETLVQVMQYEEPDVIRAIPHLSEYIVNVLVGRAEIIEGTIDMAAYVSIRQFSNRRVNGKPLSNDINLTGEDIAISSSDQTTINDADGYVNVSGVSAMGQSCPGGPLKLVNIRGNTVLGGTPAYDAPVSMASVESPLKLHVAGKNLVDFSKADKSGTAGGVSFAISEDGEISLSGTAGSSGAYVMPFGSGISKANYLPAGNYYLSCVTAGYPNDNGMYFYANVYNASGEVILKPISYDMSGASFSLTTGAWVAVNLFVRSGTHTDGISVRPQIEIGSRATDYETPSNTTVNIPLIGVGGQALEPLRMAYAGTVSIPKTAHYDRIVRLSGDWCIERKIKSQDLTGAAWTKSSSYMTPYVGGSPIVDGVTSYYPFCTHFVERGANASNQSAGIWVGSMLVVGNDVLPNGAETTAAEMQEFCSAQAEAGTPVLVSYALAQPVYEVLHQDVQMLLNTLSVPGGVCSVWFEGDILSGADIGMPRGDYPCSGVEGAYRWLEELSNPLPTPTTADLYAWALSQQRGGVFSTNGAVTTKNVPESGNLTGILSVTEQGTDVSMIAFGPTGKIHTATRIAGVWRGWVQVYSDLAPPPLMGGAAAAQAGSAGLAPAPAAGAQGKYLRGDGTWADVPESRPARYVVGTSAAGWTANDCDYLCDGTSDQTEINAAIAALPSGGGEVLVLDGTYNISSSIKINKDNVTIRGSGPATVLKRMFNSASANGVINCSAANCTIHHLAIDGNKGSYTNENNRGVYATTSAANFTIEDLVVQNSRDGIYIGGMTGGRITGCRIKDSGAYGVYVYNAEAIDISHNYIDATGETAVLITGSKSIKVDGDTITGSVNYGIRLIGSTTMCTLANNVCLDNAGGISLESASMCNVSDNLCMRGSGTPEDYDSTKITIRATSASSNNIIAGNLVMGKNVEDSGTGNLVINNKFE